MELLKVRHTMLSVLICAKNESRNLRGCIESASFADEIVVIDDFSNDGSAQLAEKLGCRVIQRSMDGDWSAQRNFGIEQCREKWIMVLDADERVSPTLKESILRSLSDSCNNEAFQVRRKNRFLHNKATHGVLKSDWVTRLFMKSTAHYEGLVHERLVTSCQIRRISDGDLDHYTYPNWQSYFAKFNRYTDLMARQRLLNGQRASFLFDIVLRPWFAFFKVYIFQLGFLDGKIGFILSVNHYFYTMTKYVKLYYLERHNGDL